MQFINRWMARVIPCIPRTLVQKISQRYIAGATLEHAVQRMQGLNRQGFGVTVDVLGESIASLEQAEHAVDAYLQTLAAIGAHGLDATVSVKPSALGLLLDRQYCEQAVGRIVQAAEDHRSAVCIDMEDVSCTDMEIALFSGLHAAGRDVSLAIQAYLRRTGDDLESLLAQGSSLRICKGIYLESSQFLVTGAQHDRSAINPHFLRHVARCFDNGTFVSIATHDAVLIRQVLALVEQRGVDRARFEFQMLLGVCEPLRDRLKAQGYAVRIYVPYGKDWYGYSTRRMKENPAIAAHVVKAMFLRR
ncbi:proline dehydrogenase [Herbaspirillum sp. CF444]|uniref:proline dehydrogenase family protein n=1 Tax=Herbaspirillum sp. CF444 TaxID=1144319 RepID=UPI00027257B9|nr:proline dehydrogenase family protein [Herbaspirillum sp. CF444]EJL89153.1 proline dehydrogenase [Herbaspirillum sp. CF444]